METSDRAQITVSVRVKAGSKKGPLIESDLDGRLIVYVREPAVDGKANNAVKLLLAKHYRIARTRVVLLSGHSSSHKRFGIS